MASLKFRMPNKKILVNSKTDAEAVLQAEILLGARYEHSGNNAINRLIEQRERQDARVGSCCTRAVRPLELELGISVSSPNHAVTVAGIVICTGKCQFSPLKFQERPYQPPSQCERSIGSSLKPRAFSTYLV